MKTISILFLVCTLSVSQCYASGYQIKTGSSTLTDENIKKITTGMSKKDVTDILGNPQNQMTMPPLGEMWTYSLSIRDTKNPAFFNIFDSPKTKISGNAVSIMFDENEKVKTVSRSNFVTPETKLTPYK